jgi:outer membrane immunogenic protein
MRFRLMLGAACTCLIASPALAADLGGPRRLPPPDNFEEPYVSPSKPPLWQGLYWGLSGGYGWGDSSGSLDANSASTDPEGFLASVSVGYNMLLGSSLLLGIEGDLGVMDVSADDEVAGDGIYRASLGPLWGTLRGRAGLAMGPLLLYGTGGLAFANLDEVSLNMGDNFAEDSELRAGWVAGGGVEFAFSQSVSAKVEYLHMDFGSTDGLADGGSAFSFDNKVDVVRAGLNFRF